ncbi:MAG: molybdenum cofactor guanylyltransferase [Desulfitobacteriaceae bacterium]
MRRRLKIIKPVPEFISSEMLPATGVLLAGGKNSRMQRNKALLELDGRPLVAWSLDILQSIFKEVLISSNEPELYKEYNVPVVRDQDLGKGPLAGLQVGLKAASHDTVFFVACDMPFLQSGPIRHLWRWTGVFDVVLPRGAFGPHPLHAYYHRRCLPFIEENLQAERLKIIDFYPQCKVKYVEEEELKRFGDVAKILSNVNTPEEWAVVSRQR